MAESASGCRPNFPFKTQSHETDLLDRNISFHWHLIFIEENTIRILQGLKGHLRRIIIASWRYKDSYKPPGRSNNNVVI